MQTDHQLSNFNMTKGISNTFKVHCDQRKSLVKARKKKQKKDKREI